MKNLFLALIFILVIASCTKIDNTPIKILGVEKSGDIMDVKFEVLRDVRMSIRPDDGFPPYYKMHSKGVYGYIGKNTRTVFDYEFGKIYVQ